MSENRFLRSPYDNLTNGLDPLPAIPERVAPAAPSAPAAPRFDFDRATGSGRTNGKGLLPPPELEGLFESAASEFDVPINVLMGMAQQESSYDPNRIGPITKYGHARGVMQYIDDTAKGMNIDPLNPAQSIRAAAAQLRDRLDLGETLQEAVAHHHGGPDRSQWGPKTAGYVNDVMRKSGEIGKGLMRRGPRAVEPEDERAAIQAELDAKAPGRFRVATDEENERYDRRDSLISQQDPLGNAISAQEKKAYQAPSPLTIDNQRKVEEAVQDIAPPSPLTPKNQMRAKAGMAPTKDLPEDQLISAIGKELGNIPEHFKQSAAGLMRSFGRDMDDQTLVTHAADIGIIKELQDRGDIEMRTEGPFNAKVPYLKNGKKAGTTEVAEYIREHADELMTPWQARALTGLKPGGITKAGESLSKDAKRSLVEVNPSGPLAKYGSLIIGSTVEMVPAIVAGMLTRSPKVAMGMIGGQVYGQSYETARDPGQGKIKQGHKEAQTYALMQAAAEAIPEALPLHFILKPGQQLFKGMLTAGAAEAVQEGFTGALNAAIDKGTIDPNMTWGEARQQIIDSMIVGAGSGALLRGGVHGVQSLASRGRTGRDQGADAIDELDEQQAPPPETPPAGDPATPPTPPAPSAPAAAATDPAPPHGPLSRAAERAPQSDTDDRVVVQTPNGEITGFLEGFHQDETGAWTASVLDERTRDTYTFNHNDGVSITRGGEPLVQPPTLSDIVEEQAAPTPEAAPSTDSPRVQVGQNPDGFINVNAQAMRDVADRRGLTSEIEDLFAQGKTARAVQQALGNKLDFLDVDERPGFVVQVRASLGIPSQQDADGQAEFAQWKQDYDARKGTAAPTEAPAPKKSYVTQATDYSNYDEPQLRAALKFVADQIKAQGINPALRTERQRIERAINALSKPAPAENLQLQTQPTQTEEQTAPGAVPTPVEQPIAATTAQTEATQSAPVKWFGTQEKAQAFIDRKKLADSHEVVQAGKSRFEIRPKDQRAGASVEATAPADASTDATPAASTQETAPTDVSSPAWETSEFAPRIRAMRDALLAGPPQAQEMWSAMEAGINSDIKHNRLTDISFRESKARETLAKYAENKPEARWEPVTIASLAADEVAFTQLPEAISQAAVDRLNELGPRLAKQGFARLEEVDGSAPTQARDLARKMMDVIHSVLLLAPARFRVAKQYKSADPEKLEQLEDSASEILGIDTRAHPGIKLDVTLTAGGVRSKPLPRKSKESVGSGTTMDTTASKPVDDTASHGTDADKTVKESAQADKGTSTDDPLKPGARVKIPKSKRSGVIEQVDEKGYHVRIDNTNDIEVFDRPALRLTQRAPDKVESTAPEHQAVGVDDRELGQIVKEFNDAHESMQTGDEQIHHLFDAPKGKEVVRLQDKARVYHSEHGWMTPAEAKERIAEWKAHARAQGGRSSPNADKIVLSLFDLTGKWSQPWEEAGYQVYRFDIQDDPEVGDVHNFSAGFFGDWFGDFDGQDIYAVLAACPCTDFASSGARHFAAKDNDGRTVASVKLVHQTLAAIEYFKPAVWAIENPVGRIEKLGGLPPWRLSFDPNHLGDPYTKKTLIWGRFNGDLPIAPVEPTEGSKMHSKYGGKSIATKNARSATPEGFAYGFFMANNAIDNPVMAVANKYDRLDRNVIEQAVNAGMTSAEIAELVDDPYYMDLDDQAAEQALRDAVAERAGTETPGVSEPGDDPFAAHNALIDRIKKKVGATKQFNDKKGRRITLTFKHIPSATDGDFLIEATTDEGKVIGNIGPAFDTREGFSFADSHIDEGYRRAGIATAAYDFAEELSGVKLSRSGTQSYDAEAFWNAREGKSKQADISHTPTAPAPVPGQMVELGKGRNEVHIVEADDRQVKVREDKRVQTMSREDFDRRMAEARAVAEHPDTKLVEMPRVSFDREIGPDEQLTSTPEYQEYQRRVDRLNEIQAELDGGTYKGPLSAAGVNRALLALKSNRSVLAAQFAEAREETESSESETAPAPEAKASDDRFAKNTLFTQDKVAEARARLKSKLGRLHSGFDPELAIDGMTLAGAYIESGVRNFTDYARLMVEDIGPRIKPYLLTFWEGARAYPGLDTTGMTSVEDSAREHAALTKPEDLPAEEAKALGSEVKKPAKRKKKDGTKGDTTLTQDFGVDHIDGYGDSYERENGNSVKDQFMKDAAKYLGAVADILRERGFTAHPDRKGLPQKPVSKNEGGVAGSGDITLTMRRPGANIYVHVGDSALRGAVPTTASGIALMYRVSTTPNDQFATRNSTNRWAPTTLSAADLADMIVKEADGKAPVLSRPAQENANADTQAAEDANRADAQGAEPAAVQENAGQRTTGSADTAADGRVQRERGDSTQRDNQPVGDNGQTGQGAGAQQPLPTDRATSTRSDSGENSRARNYRIRPGELTRTGSWKATAEQNIRIVELVKQLTSEGRQATPEEKALITKFTGWGASEIANGVFPTQFGQFKPDWRELGERLQKALTPEEYAQARRTTQYAHYTSEPIIRSVYAAFNRFGFNGGNVLEPGMGVGLFNGLMPDAIAANSHYTGVEYDTITGNIARLLYPQSNMIVGDYTATKLPRDFFDAAIGNPPFGQIKISSDPEYKKHNFLLHDYFFAKTIDRVKPGGLLVFVTSKGTMDKGNDRARRYLAERANLLGAIRLPQTAFKENAGTEVVTDVIFLQKRGEGIEDNGIAWGGLAEVQTPQGPAHINEYFVANPQMVLGTHALTGTMYRANEYTVEPIKGEDIETQFARAIEHLPENVYRPARGSQAEAAAVQQRDYDPKIKKEGGIYQADDGTMMVVEDGQGVALTERIGSNGKPIALKPKEVDWLKGYVGVRDALKQTQYDQLNEGDWETSLAALNKAYDQFTKKHGPLLAHTVTEKENEDGTVSVTRRFKNDPLLRLDTEGALAYALETINPDGTISKGAVLKGRILNKPKPPEITSAQDAMFVTLNDLGRLDLDVAAAHVGMTRDEIIRELGTSIYEDPSEGWQTHDAYLSGNVVRKLYEARSAARLDKRFERNIAALEAVQPQPLAPADITVQLGSAWIPPSDVANFAGEHLGEKIQVTYSPVTGQWTTEGASRSVSEWGFKHLSPADILGAVLNNRQLKVTYRDAEGKTHTDAEATEKVNDIAKKMRAGFKRWIWTDANRASRLAKYYNEHFNNIAPRTFDGSHLTLPGVSSRFKLYPHQKRAVWRIVQQGDGYLAHAVGAGKTMEMIAAGMEERRLGLSKKPMYVVPNHMLAQFSKEFLELYPTASIMVADEQNFHTHNRRKFVAQAALNDPDAIIITHSAFGRIGMSSTFTESYIRDQISEWEYAKAEADKGDRVTVKQIERRIEQLENRLKAITDGSKKDQVLSFEELGVDRLFVDEMHEFRKLDFPTNRGNVKGIDPSGSQRSMDMHMKVQYLRSKRPGRAIVGASGTPVTNTMGELFTLQRIFQPAQLEEDGLDNFDAWSSQFGEVVEALEQNAAGGYEAVSRFARFVNVPELMSRVRSVMDILTSEQLGQLVQRPIAEGGGREVVVTPSPEGYKAYQKTLEDRIRLIRLRKGPPVKGQDIILNVIADGRFSAIDMRFVDPDLPSDPNSKLNRMLDDMIETYHRTADNEYSTNGTPDELKGASLMLFTDIGLGEQSAATRGFDMKAWIEKRLVEGGVDPKHIAFMRDHKAHAKKERLFNDMRQGRKRILIGGKDMETGVNAQKRLVELFHLDAPWFPASVEQREGRIIRQGNQNKKVRIRAYATKGSYDSTMWGMNARKARFIEQAMSGDTSVRAMEDVSEASAFEMASALASGDERYLKMAGLKQDVERLGRLYSAHMDDQRRLRSEQAGAQSNITWNGEKLGRIDAALKRRKPLRGDEFSATIDGQNFDSRDDFSERLFSHFKGLAEKYTLGDQVIGNIGGFDIKYVGINDQLSKSFAAEVVLDLPTDPDPLIAFPIDPEMSIKGMAQRAVNQIYHLDAAAQSARDAIERSTRRLEQIDSRMGAPFAEQAELAEKQQALFEIETELAKENASANSDAAAATAEVEGSAPVPGDQDKKSINANPNRVSADPNRVLDAAKVDAILRQGNVGLPLGHLLDSGKITVHNTSPDSAHIGLQGWTDARGQIHLVADQLTRKTAPAVLLHEAIHSGGESLVGSRRWANLMKRLDELYSRGEKGRLKGGWGVAYARVKAAQYVGDSMSRERAVEELGAYAAESYELASPGMRKWVDSLTGTIKEWAYRRFGVQLGDVTPAQMRALAAQSLRSLDSATMNAGRMAATLDPNAQDDGGNGDIVSRATADENARRSIRTEPTVDTLPNDPAEALNEAINQLNEDPDAPPKQDRPDYIGQLTKDIGRIAKLVLHPRQIASLHQPFTKVYQTAINQFEMRDRTIAELQTDHAAYDQLPQAGKQKVNKLLELGRLMSTTYDEASLRQGIENKGYRSTIKFTEGGSSYRSKEKVNALLTAPGETVTLNDQEIEAYLGLRQLFDRALDKFRDQSLIDFGFPELVGQANTAQAVLDEIKPHTQPGRAERLQQISRFMAEIEQAKRAGYVPFARYGDYIVAVKEQLFPLDIIKNPDGGWLARDLPTYYDQFMTEIGATWNGLEDAWQMNDTQKRALQRENDKTLYSAKVEFTLADKVRLKRGAKVEDLPSVKAALAEAEKWKEGRPERRTVAFEAIQKKPEGGVSLSDVDALAEVAMLDTDTWDAVREQLADAVKGRSFRKHFFASENVPGYTGDFERAIADYIGGMSGYLSRQHYAKDWDRNIQTIKAPRLYEYANRYRQYANTPQEELGALRQIGFFHYIAGVPATAFVNLTQPFLMTIPALSQVASMPVVLNEMRKAYIDAMKMFRLNQRVGLDLFDPTKAPADVRTELAAAWAEGAFVPLQTYEILGTAQQRNVGARKVARYWNKTVAATATLFSFAERLNRLVTFIASARLSQRPSVKARAQQVWGKNSLAQETVLRSWNARAFSEFMIDESQFRMGKANRAQIMRGPGAVILQFKGFIMQSLEAWFRWAKLNGIQGLKGVAMSLGVMVALGGLWGLPGGDDLRDAIEKAYKVVTKEDLDIKTDARQWIYETTGQQWLSEVATKGATYPLGLDLSRVGMGGIAPDSPLQVFGIPADLFIGRPTRAFQMGSQGNYVGAVAEFLPNVLKNPITAWGWGVNGVQSKGKTLVPAESVKLSEQGLKAMGFAPTRFTNIRDYEYAQYRMQTAVDAKKAAYLNRLAKNYVKLGSPDPGKRADAIDELRDINSEILEYNREASPEARIQIGRTALNSRLRQEHGGIQATWGRERKQARGASASMRETFGLTEDDAP